VVSLRNPVERAYSHYWHERRNGWEWLPFIDAIRRDPREEPSGLYWRRYCYIERSLYRGQLERAAEAVGKDNLIVVKFEDLTREPLETTNRILLRLRPEIAPLVRLDTRAPSGLRSNSGIPRTPIAHEVVARARRTLGMPLVPNAAMRMWLRPERQPPLTPEEYAVARALITREEPSIVDLYPDL